MLLIISGSSPGVPKIIIGPNLLFFLSPKKSFLAPLCIFGWIITPWNSDDILSRYCNLDYDREIAIVAELLDEKRIIGVVRLILDSERKNGEFAIMVSDSWHGLGLGSKLMDFIVEISKDLKVETIYSQVTRSNTK